MAGLGKNKKGRRAELVSGRRTHIRGGGLPTGPEEKGRLGPRRKIKEKVAGGLGLRRRR